MSSPSKAKGNRAEKKVVDLLTEHGILDTKRAWGSNGRALGCHEEVDVLANGCKIQVKARKALPSIIRDALTEHVDAAILYADRQPPVVVIKLEEFTRMLRENVYRR